MLDLDTALWRFNTARYTIAFFAEPEDMDPADSFDDPRDIAFAREDDPARWFYAIVAVFDNEGRELGCNALGGCSYNSFEEFYASHRWQYSRRQRRFITDPKSRAWKACKAAQRRPRSNGTYFTDMVSEAVKEARIRLAGGIDGLVQYVNR